MSLRNAAPLLPSLKDGEYDAILKAATYFPETKTAGDGYTLQIELPDRIITERKFDQSFTISISHLRKQLGDESIIPAQLDDNGNLVKTSSELFLQSVIDGPTPFKVFVETVTVTKRDGTVTQQRNINFLPPLKKAATAGMVIQSLDEIEVV